MSSPKKASSVSRRLEVHRQPVDAPSTSARTPRDESLRDCRICKSEHALRKCPRFRKMSVRERWETVKKFQYCFNCLAHSHMRDKCTSRERCSECKSDHHTFLHRHKKAIKSSRSDTPRAQNQAKNRRNKKGRNNNSTNPTNTQQHQCCMAVSPRQHQHCYHPQQQRQQYQQQHIPPQTPATIVINVMSGHIV